MRRLEADFSSVGGKSCDLYLIDSRSTRRTARQAEHRPLNCTVAGGQVQDIQDAPGPVSNETYEGAKWVSRSKAKAACRSDPQARHQTSPMSQALYRQRPKFENHFCRITDWRRIADRYKLAKSFVVGIPPSYALSDRVVNPDPSSNYTIAPVKLSSPLPIDRASLPN
jgi:hypothetical protein